MNIFGIFVETERMTNEWIFFNGKKWKEIENHIFADAFLLLHAKNLLFNNCSTDDQLIWIIISMDRDFEKKKKKKKQNDDEDGEKKVKINDLFPSFPISYPILCSIYCTIYALCYLCSLCSMLLYICWEELRGRWIGNESQESWFIDNTSLTPFYSIHSLAMNMLYALCYSPISMS